MEYILTALILALLIERFLTERSRSKERSDLICAVIAKNQQEYTQGTQPAPQNEDVKEQKDQFYSVDSLDDSEFIDIINGKQES